MLIEPPDPQFYGAQALMGREDSDMGPLQMGVVLKSAYDLIGGSGPRTMVPSDDPARHAVLLQDEGNHIYRQGDGTEHPIPPGDIGVKPDTEEEEPHRNELFFIFDGGELFPSTLDEDEFLLFHVTREADTALEKDRTDLVVEGFISGSDTGTLVVDGSDWLTRTIPPGDPFPDTTLNLFGYQPRSSSDREAIRDDTSDFANFHRRGVPFNDVGLGASLPSGGIVEVYQGADRSGDPDYALTLPDLERAARLRVYCGHGPDEAPYWRQVEIGDMRPDTLIIRPTENQAEILWRIHWDADLEPLDSYRSVQIREGGF
ncbi:MAG: hypothetical protein AAF526_01050 [Pseudomonadota bacterium]